MEEVVTVTNRVADATCLIFKAQTNEDGKQATVEMWTNEEMKPGLVILSNTSVGFVVSERGKERFHFREWEVVKVLETKDMNGQWTNDRARRNKQSRHTVTVIPWSKPKETKET